MKKEEIIKEFRDLSLMLCGEEHKWAEDFWLSKLKAQTQDFKKIVEEGEKGENGTPMERAYLRGYSQRGADILKAMEEL